MKTFEERYTAWLDGGLTTEAQTAFEKELTERGEPLEAKSDYLQFRAFYAASSTAPKLESADFFNHSVFQNLEEPDQKQRAASAGWSLPRLAWLGGLSMTTALVLFIAIIPKKSETHSQAAYIAQVISARSADPQISATAFQTHPFENDDMTVVWLDGLDYVPANVPENAQ